MAGEPTRETERGTPSARGSRSRVGGLLAMTRPSVVGLVFFTGLPALAIDDGVWPSWTLSTAILAGIALCAAASSVFNAWLERDIDAKMERTRNRPLPTGLVTPQWAWMWAWFLTVAGIAVLAAAGGWQGALAGALTIAF
ncbi:MAG: UbiA family prenyltransferase [Deltaproteobacteria bacterium]|nr:UbiA family prenyltransferase [Deltaproteobacteria bacterium]